MAGWCSGTVGLLLARCPESMHISVRGQISFIFDEAVTGPANSIWDLGRGLLLVLCRERFYPLHSKHFWGSDTVACRSGCGNCEYEYERISLLFVGRERTIDS